MAVWPVFALAWNPYPDASNPPPEEQRWARPQSTGTLNPFRAPTPAPAPVYAAPAYTAPAPAYTAPAATAYIAPAPIYAAPEPVAYAAPAPAYTAPAPAYAAPAPAPVQAVQYYEAAPVETAPAMPPQSIYYDPMAQPYSAPVAMTQDAPTMEWYGGVQAFYDQYREPTLGVETESVYGALTGGFDYYDDWLYTGLDARISYGQADYESGSGTIDGIPEQEYELRWKIGYDYTENGRGFIPYTGLAMRYYQMDLKGETTNLGAAGYDRNIFQLYMPFGMRFDGPFAGWDVRSTLEADLLLYGNVSSRLGTLGGGFENANNRQSFGSGGALRGEMMFAQRRAGGGYYEFGPFFRYWKFKDSETDSQPIGTFLEPENDRFQVGAEMRYHF